MSTVTLDFETKSRVDIKKAGAYRYAADPSTEVLCLSYQIDDGPIKTWAPGLPNPRDLFGAMMYEKGALKAHNAVFERLIWHHVCERLYAWPIVLFSRWRCTMAAAFYRAIPGKLENAALALKLTEQKDMAGNKFGIAASKPVKVTAKNPTGWREDIETMERVYLYCEQDVRAEHELDTVVGDLPPGELAVWQLDQEINDRGIQVDVAAAAACVRIIDKMKATLHAELATLTGGAVQTVGQIQKLKEWLDGQGLYTPDLQATTVEAALAENHPGAVGRVIEIKHTLQSSTAKAQTFLDCVGADGRVRGLMQYHGAATGRWAGRLAQPHNFKRPSKLFEDVDGDKLIADIMYEDAAYLEMVYGSTNEAVAHALRPILMAAPDKSLTAGDFSAIEAVVTAAIAGDERKLDVFRSGADPYCVFAEAVFGYAVNKKEHPIERTVGKMGELSFGFGGGVGAWRNFEPKGVESPHTDDDIDGYKNMWREQHPYIAGDRELGITGLWRSLEEAALAAIYTKQPSSTHGVTYYWDESGGDWLGCRLASGRTIWYREPRVVEAKMPWTDRYGNAVFKPQMEYWAWKPIKGGWVPVRAWGGHLTENVVQATARDIMVEAMFRAEAAGHKIVLTVHDEIVTEGDCRADELKRIMEIRPKWAEHWPLKVSAWEGNRYRK
jgi:DNA polymerase bacteriophage-type